MYVKPSVIRFVDWLKIRVSLAFDSVEHCSLGYMSFPCSPTQQQPNLFLIDDEPLKYNITEVNLNKALNLLIIQVWLI